MVLIVATEGSPRSNARSPKLPPSPSARLVSRPSSSTLLDLDRAVADQIKLLRRLASPQDHVAGRMLLGPHLVGDRGERGGGETLERPQLLDEIANQRRLADDDVRFHPAVDHAHHAVGHVENPIVVGDHHDRHLLVAGQFLKQRDGLAPDFSSSAAVGSSASSSLGRCANPRAMATRCFWPPESERGL